MFSKFPDVFGRSFIIGFFVPALLSVSTSIFILETFNLSRLFSQLTSSKIDILTLTTVIGIASLFFSIFLLSLNREFIRITEGYGKFNPLRLLAFIERYNFRRNQREILKLDEKYRLFSKQGQEIPLKLKQRRYLLLLRSAQRFPDEERWLLPTSFGNTVRAFEVYSRIMYGIDSIPTWNRLLALIPEHYLEYIEDSKAKVDLWINVLFVGIFLLCEYTAILFYVGYIKLVWFPFIILASVFIAYLRAQESATEWGDFVKASFDLFLPDLYKKLEFDSSNYINMNEKEILHKFSQAILYRNPKYMPNKSDKNDRKSE